MNMRFAPFRHVLRMCAVTALALSVAGMAGAQSPAVRIHSDISSSQMTALRGSLLPLANAQHDIGRVPASTKLLDMTISFSLSPAQQADLQALLQAQQDPNSPQYHQWLTPEQYGARFGMADADIEQVENWLQQQGFTVNSVNRARNAIHFSGTAGQVEQAFATEMHYYQYGQEKHFAPSTALSLPAAIAPVVLGIQGLNDFRPRPMHIRGSAVSAKPQYTYCTSSTCSTANQGVLFAPGDIKTAYDINPLLSAGNNGAGQVIAIMGQSAITTSDITNFQAAAGLAQKAPIMTLVPNTGSAEEVAGDESESDLDVEWSGAIATGATINFVYTGNSTSASNNGVFSSYQYAVDNQIGNIISLSYGSCETEMAGTDYSTYEQVGAEAAAQGQTVVAASGDQGATACYGYEPDGLSTAQADALVVNYPASSAYVTGVGGTEITAANDAVGTYWLSASSSSSSIVVNSATQYIPEVAWNDDALSAVSGCNTTTNPYECVSASGGGISTLSTSQPSWQTAYFTATGEANPSSGHRLVPDVALYASPNYPGYLYCTSDQSAWSQGQEGSCGNNEFYDPVSEYFTVAGGTSFAAPIFAGMLAIVNQDKGYASGQGLANSELYSLAANSATYAAAFHDVTSGNNECTESLSYCPSSSGYSAGVGYDMVTGLGSVDLNNLATAYSTSTSTLVGTTTTITASNSSPNVNTADTFTVTVSANSGTVVPAGVVSVSIDGGAATSYNLTTSGTAATTSFSYTFTTAGAHTLAATYAATTTFAASTGTLTVNAQGVSSGKGTFSMGFSPSTLTVAQGSQGTETLTVTPASGYTGTVVLNYDTSNDTALANLCLFAASGFDSNGNMDVTGTAAVTGQITVDTNASDCADTTGAVQPRRLILHHIKNSTMARNTPPAKKSQLPAGIALGGLLLAGFLGRGSRKLRALACVLAFAAVSFGMSACGGGVTTTTLSNPPKGTYTITFSGADSVTTSITSSASFTLTIN